MSWRDGMYHKFEETAKQVFGDSVLVDQEQVEKLKRFWSEAFTEGWSQSKDYDPQWDSD